MYDISPPLTASQLAYALQREAQAQSALDRVLRLAHLLTAVPRDDVPPAVAAGLDALGEALATYDYWTPPGQLGL